MTPTRRAYVAGLGLLPILAWGYLTFVEPRPFAVAAFDAEHLSYYSALLLRNGQPGINIHNPGIPAYQMARLAVAVLGDDAAQVERVLVLCRLLAAVLLAIALASVVAWSFKDKPLGIISLALAPVLAWPSFLIFLDYFDPICLQPVVGLPAIAVCYHALGMRAGASERRHWYMAAGVAIGVSLAVKLTFAPLAIAMTIATLWREEPARESWRHRFVDVARVIGGASVAFCAATFPLTGEVSKMATIFLTRQDFAPEATADAPMLASGWLSLVARSPAIAILVVAAVGAAVMLVWWAPRSRQAAFLALMMVAAVFTISVARGSLGGLRHAQASVLAVPFVVGAVFDRLALVRSRWVSARGLLFAAGVLALVSIGDAAFAAAVDRRAFIDGHVRHTRATRAALHERNQKGGRIAVWDGSVIGPAGFHFWGNYRYGCDYRSASLLQTYPDSSFLRLREVKRIVRERRSRRVPRSSTLVRPAPRRFNALRRVYSTVLTTSVCPRPADELVAGESISIRPSLIAFPESELHELPKSDLEPLLALIRSRFGMPSVEQAVLDGEPWVLITVGAAAEPR